MHSTKIISEDEFLEYLSRQCIDWDEGEKRQISRFFTGYNKAYENFKHLLPKEVYLIKTNGRDDNDAAYTRGHHVYIPTSWLRYSELEVKEVIAHEIFHVITRYNAKLKENWYRKLGFKCCPEINISEGMKGQELVTNPDTVGKNCYIVEDEKQLVPILYVKESYNGGNFFQMLRFSYIQCDISMDSCLPQKENGSLKFINPPEDLFKLCQELDPYQNQHRLHPEEILAYFWAIIAIPAALRRPDQDSFHEKIERLMVNKSIENASK